MTAEAMKVADPIERGRMLAAMPTCARGEDGATAIIVAPPPPPPETTPFAPNFAAALRVGVAASSMSSGSDDAASGVGPYVELEGSWHFHRHLEVAVFGAYTTFGDTVVAAIGTTINGNAVYGVYAVHDQLYDAGARLRLRYDKAAFGVGLGFELEKGVAYAAYPNYANVLEQAQFMGSYRIADHGRFAIDLLGVGAFALNGSRLWNQPDRDVMSLRFALGVQLH
jgi:hypothetical protein